MKALVSRRFQPGEGPRRGLLRDCENRLWNRWIDLRHYSWVSPWPRRRPRPPRGQGTWGRPRHGAGLGSIAASTLALPSPRLAAPQSCNDTKVKIKTGGGLYNQEWRTIFTLKSTCIWTDFHTLPQPSMSAHWNFPWTEFTVKRSQKPLASLSSKNSFWIFWCFYKKNVMKVNM